MLLDAYSHGIFPWPIAERRKMILAWWSPDPRAVLEMDDLYASRRLQRRVRSGQFEIRINCDFAGVVAACAEPRGDDSGTWITDSMRAAYQRLHKLGYAHSIETWHENRLVGGVYGVSIGGFFAGESMFYRMRDASKVALVHLVRRLRQRGFTLFDIQQSTPHTARLGAELIPRDEYLTRLKSAVALPVTFLSEEPQID